MHNKISFSKR